MLDEETGDSLLASSAARLVRRGGRPAGEVPARASGRSLLSVMGVLLVAAGLLLLIAFNWSALPGWFKVCLTVGCMTAAYLFGYHYSFCEGSSRPWTGWCLTLLGGVFYGGSLMTISQVFHVSSPWYEGMFLWGAGLLPMSAALAHCGLLGLALFVFWIWYSWTWISSAGGLLLYGAIVGGVCIPLSVRTRSRILLAASLFLFSSWYLGSFVPWWCSGTAAWWWSAGRNAGLPLLLTHGPLYGALLLVWGSPLPWRGVAAASHPCGEAGRLCSGVFEAFGSVIALGTTFMAAYSPIVDELKQLGDSSERSSAGGGGLFLAVLALVLAGLWVTLRSSGAPGWKPRGIAIFVSAAACAAVVVLLVPAFPSVPSWAYCLFFNLACLALCTGLMLSGLADDEGVVRFRIGAGAFGLLLFVRFLDTSFGYVVKSLVFMSIGAALWYLSVRGRRKGRERREGK